MNTKPRNTKKKESPGSKISSAVGNYEDHPFFVKKADEAKKIIGRTGIPKVTKKRP